MKLHVLYSTIYFGIIAEPSLGDSKAYRILEDIKEEFTKLYKGNIEIVLSQTNLTSNCLDKMFLK